MRQLLIPKRRTLKNIAYGVAGRFVSRNNDVNGYWALGLFYSAASENGTNHACLDLLAETTNPEFRYSSHAVSAFKNYLDVRLEQELLTGHVTLARIDIQFNVEPGPLDLQYRCTWGDPFTCTVTITDDRNITREAKLRGWCGHHDSKKERRSTRQFAS